MGLSGTKYWISPQSEMSAWCLGEEWLHIGVCTGTVVLGGVQGGA